MKSRIALRIVVPFMVISVLLLGIGGGGAWMVHRANHEVSDVLVRNLDALLASEELVLALRETRLTLQGYLTTSEHLELEAALAHRQETDKAFAAAELSASSDRARAIIAQARQAHDRFFDELASLARQPQTRAVKDRISGLRSELTDHVLTKAMLMLDTNRRVAVTNSARNLVLADQLGLVLLLLGFCGAVAGLLAGFAIARGIIRSIVQLSLPVRDTAGKLGEVVGPIALAADAGFPELQIVMRTIAEETGRVVKRLQQSQREALRREQLAAVGQLAAGLAHELRNPLTAMKILVQAAAADSQMLREQDLTVLAEEITRLEQLTRTFLDFARPEQLEKRVLDVRGLVEQTVRVVAGRAAQQQVAIECRVPDEPLTIEADAAQVRQVLLNLLLNSLDALPRGGRVSVDVARADEFPPSVALSSGDAQSARGPDAPETQQVSDLSSNGDSLLLRVGDNGPGLPAELGERIFEPFVSTRGTGMGLGLTICRRIVEAHGGAIGAGRGAEGGAAFWVQLPLAAVSQPDTPPRPDATCLSSSINAR